MFHYSLKTKILLALALVVLIILSIILVQWQNSRTRDLELISQVRALATGLENYYSQFNAYPEIKKTKAYDIDILTENGFNQAGKKVYFNGDINWAGEATLAANSTNYSLEFSLKNSWPVWGLSQAGRCRFTANMAMQCIAGK